MDPTPKILVTLNLKPLHFYFKKPPKNLEETKTFKILLSWTNFAPPRILIGCRIGKNTGTLQYRYVT